MTEISGRLGYIAPYLDEIAPDIVSALKEEWARAEADDEAELSIFDEMS